MLEITLQAFRDFWDFLVRSWVHYLKITANPRQPVRTLLMKKRNKR